MYVIYCKIMYSKFYLTFGALHIAVLFFERAKKKIFLVSAKSILATFPSFARERLPLQRCQNPLSYSFAC